MSDATRIRLDPDSIDAVVNTLTQARLSKYLSATHNDRRQALHLYVLNTEVSAAVMTDLHYIEVALRNKFDLVLSARYGPQWFSESRFTSIVNPDTQRILQKAQRNAGKHRSASRATPPGKVIAELTFGFWHRLTDSNLEHGLWTPCLHKAFVPRKAPKRSAFNQQLERLRHLRNRVAHHEPIFHLDLHAAYERIVAVGALLCPTMTLIMTENSTLSERFANLVSYTDKYGTNEDTQTTLPTATSSAARAAAATGWDGSAGRR
jgi:hypothetical protein